MSREQFLVILGPDDHHRGADIAGDIRQIHAVRSVFPDGEQLVAVPDPGSIRGRHVLITQTTAPPQDMRLITVCQLAELAVAAGAASTTCFLPYLCYQRQDKAASPGQALSSLIVLRLIRSTGAQTVLTVDRHSTPPWDGRQGLPDVVSLTCAEPVAEVLKAQDEQIDCVVATDRGGTKRASRIAEELGLPVVILTKLKSAGRGTYYEALPDTLRGRRLLVVDDVCTSGSTIRPLCASLAAAGARMTVFVTHVVPTPQGRVTAIKGVDRFLCSDSCGDRTAAVRVMPLALHHWISGFTRDVGQPGERALDPVPTGAPD